MKFKLIEVACLVVLVLSFQSCTSYSDAVLRNVTLRLSVSDSPLSRVTGASVAAESSISSLQVLLFDENGALVSYGSSSSTSVLVRCSCGRRSVWVFANAPSLSGISTFAELVSFRFPLECNSASSLLMYGSEDMLVESNMSKTIQLSRMCAKVVLSRLTKSFSSEVIQDMDFVLEKVYMTNVVAEYTLEGAPVPCLWYNKMGWNAECDGLLCDDVGVSVTSSLEGEHTFYVFPNRSTSDARGGEWSPRCTRMVLKASLGGEPVYYVIDIPDIRANCSYVISNVKITRPGSSDEEHKTDECVVEFSLSVSDWSEYSTYYENL